MSDVELYELVEYTPENSASSDARGLLKFVHSDGSSFVRPYESSIRVTGRLVKSDGTAYAATDNIAFVNNGIMYLFDEAKYEIGTTTVETVKEPGRATTMMGALLYDPKFSEAHGHSQLWQKDSGSKPIAFPIDHPSRNGGFAARQSLITARGGNFTVTIPLSDIFGFIDDYEETMHDVRHCLMLNRKNDDNDAIFGTSGEAAVTGANPFAAIPAATAGKIVIDSITWQLPHVKFSDLTKLTYARAMQENALMTAAFRSRSLEEQSVGASTLFSWTFGTRISPETPRYVLIAFQTNRRNNQAANSAVFDHCNVLNAYVKLDTRDYPALKKNANFTANDFGRFYSDSIRFKSKYYGIDHKLLRLGVTPTEFQQYYPILVFDVSNQELTPKTSANFSLNVEFREAPPAGTVAYAVIITDKEIRMQAGGGKFAIVS